MVRDTMYNIPCDTLYDTPRDALTDTLYHLTLKMTHIQTQFKIAESFVQCRFIFRLINK